MYSETIQTLSEQAAVKLIEQKRSLLGHLVRSMAAGMYVGGAIILIFTIGGLLAGSSPALVRILMGVCFGGALNASLTSSPAQNCSTPASATSF